MLVSKIYGVGTLSWPLNVVCQLVLCYASLFCFDFFLSVCPSFCLSVCLSVRPSVCLSVCLSVSQETGLFHLKSDFLRRR